MDMKNGMDSYAASETEEEIVKYPTPDKQYAGALRYCSYESLQTGAAGKPAKK
jgi:hypothetical protein